MEKISTPTGRAYYPASPNEPSRVLCWMPPEELARMAEKGEAPPGLLDDHPDGLEVEVSALEFAEFGIVLEAEPDALRQAYLDLLKDDQLPASGMVDGRALEMAALGIGMMSFSTVGKLPEPEMSDGQDVTTLLKGL
jgi:hypothetical protein